MSLKAVIVASDSENADGFRFEQYRLRETLGAEEELAVRLDEVVRAVSESVRGSIEETSELTVEMTGSVSLKAQGGAKWMFVNIGGSATTSDALKVTLKTTIKPVGADRSTR